MQAVKEREPAPGSRLGRHWSRFFQSLFASSLLATSLIPEETNAGETTRTHAMANSTSSIHSERARKIGPVEVESEDLGPGVAQRLFNAARQSDRITGKKSTNKLRLEQCTFQLFIGYGYPGAIGIRINYLITKSDESMNGQRGITYPIGQIKDNGYIVINDWFDMSFGWNISKKVPLSDKQKDVLRNLILKKLAEAHNHHFMQESRTPPASLSPPVSPLPAPFLESSSSLSI